MIVIRSLPTSVFLFLCVGGLLLPLGACDTGASKQDAQFRSLTGTWEVHRLLAGQTPYQRLDVQFEFGDDDDGRYYRITRRASEDTTTVRGGVDMLGSNEIRMREGFRHPLVWSFRFDKPDDLRSSVRFYLIRTWEGSGQAFLDAVGVGGGARRIEVDLVRD